jgi:hypothetical protein
VAIGDVSAQKINGKHKKPHKTRHWLWRQALARRYRQRVPALPRHLPQCLQQQGQQQSHRP